MLLSAIMAFSGSLFAGTLDEIKQRGYLKCGVGTGLPGFGYINEQGQWDGFDVLFCRATAAAIFNDPTKVEFTPTTGKTRFTTLQSKEIDLLYRTTTWTLTRDTDLGLAFSSVNYYDGQGFLVSKDLGVDKVSDLNGASMCVIQGTTTELNLESYFKDNNLTYSPIYVENFQAMLQAFVAGRCDAVTSDAAGLAAMKTTFENPSLYKVLPEIISKEPLGPVVRSDDHEFMKLVQWVYLSTVQAEEYGITSANVDRMKGTTGDIDRFLGVTKNTAPQIGLSEDCAYRVVKHVGNYGEIFERTIGVNTPLGLQRGYNALWTQGGLQYSHPFR